jgi:hypothetical protein
MGKSHGHISRVSALGLILSKEDPLNVYKIESTLESDKLCLNGWLRNMVILNNVYRERANRVTIKKQNDHVTRKYLEDFAWVWALTLLMCTQSNPHEN